MRQFRQAVYNPDGGSGAVGSSAVARVAPMTAGPANMVGLLKRAIGNLGLNSDSVTLLRSAGFSYTHEVVVYSRETLRSKLISGTPDVSGKKLDSVISNVNSTIESHGLTLGMSIDAETRRQVTTQ
ncbi:hypothetical protein HY988_01385 [Candidatus Micrarchaeota archaeon]|nr:hypothetical protein [Candidatus Micrarchaeota archaeon]